MGTLCAVLEQPAYSLCIYELDFFLFFEGSCSLWWKQPSPSSYSATILMAVDTVKNCTPDDGCIKHSKHVEWT